MRKAASGLSRHRLASLAFLACATGCTDGGGSPEAWLAGRVSDSQLTEISGAAASLRQPGSFWLLEDSDAPTRLTRVNSRGELLQRVSIDGATNRDWEDLSSAVIDGVPTLVIADIGDNEAKHPSVFLYVVAEPAAGAESAVPAGRIEFRYPDGPRDAEALAYDGSRDEFLVLTKRDEPARVYALERSGLDGDGPVTASFRGVADALVQPGVADRLMAHFRKSWFWQPTAMDISPDGNALVVLTYSGLYLLPRTPEGFDFRNRGRSLRFAGLGIAEAVAFDGDGLFVTVEASEAPIYRVPLNAMLPRP